MRKVTKEDRKSAIKLSIKVWTYLRDHPAIYSKYDMPPSLFDKIRHQLCHCPLCTLYNAATEEDEVSPERCTPCPLNTGHREHRKGTRVPCAQGNHPFYRWINSSCIGEQAEADRRKAAGEIVDILTKTLEEEFPCVKKQNA